MVKNVIHAYVALCNTEKTAYLVPTMRESCALLVLGRRAAVCSEDLVSLRFHLRPSAQAVNTNQPQARSPSK